MIRSLTTRPFGLILTSRNGTPGLRVLEMRATTSERPLVSSTDPSAVSGSPGIVYVLISRCRAANSRAVSVIDGVGVRTRVLPQAVAMSESAARKSSGQGFIPRC